VSEPYLQSAVRPEILFPAYFAGFNLVESFYLAIPHLSWQTLVIGDPLCAPFPRKALTRADIEKPVDPATEMPALFKARRLSSARATLGELGTEALTATLQAEVRLARRDQVGAMEALHRATALAPGAAGLQLQLGLLLDQTGQYDGALERYRRVLALQPNNPIAMNNLAYGLAVRKDLVAEAHPLAKRAVALAPNDPTVIDTLAWIEHLLGNEEVASKLLTEALRRGTRNAEIHFHAAVVYAARNAWAAAATQLKAALQLDPALETREDVRQLRSRIQAAGRSPGDTGFGCSTLQIMMTSVLHTGARECLI
ncbi:MAG: tetratricopeptide repeat protein, partial [Acidobacteria bacterium]|nr:tetratricopeptide repeat protein [Acidobacteriota bacterium]